MNIKTDNQNDNDVREATLLRTLSLMCDSWEDENTSISDMTRQLEEARKVVRGECTFRQFAESTNLDGRELLN